MKVHIHTFQVFKMQRHHGQIINLFHLFNKYNKIKQTLIRDNNSGMSFQQKHFFINKLNFNGVGVK